MPDVNFSVKVSGVPELQRRIGALKQKIATREVKRATRAGAQKIADAARENAYMFDNPATAENVAANVAVQFGSIYTRQTGDVMYRVGVLGGAKNPGAERFEYAARRLSGSGELPGGETWYFRLLEFGASTVEAKPFLRDAADRASGAAAEEVATVLEQGLDRAVREL